MTSISGSTSDGVAISTGYVPRRKTASRMAPARKGRPKSAALRPLGALGAQVRRLRLERDLSQERLAELAGVNYKYLGRVELSKADPGATVLVRLARALVVPVGEIFDTITPMNAAPYRLSPVDIEAVAAALATLTSVVDGILKRQPGPTPGRARRRSRR
jgi:transcriptional regulator with XRE-family HTH domain